MVKPTNMEMASSAINGKGELYVPNSYNCERNYKETIEKKTYPNLTYILCYNISYVYNYSRYIPSQKQKTH